MIFSKKYKKYYHPDWEKERYIVFTHHRNQIDCIVGNRKQHQYWQTLFHEACHCIAFIMIRYNQFKTARSHLTCPLLFCSRSILRSINALDAITKRPINLAGAHREHHDGRMKTRRGRCDHNIRHEKCNFVPNTHMWQTIVEMENGETVENHVAAVRRNGPQNVWVDVCSDIYPISS